MRLKEAHEHKEYWMVRQYDARLYADVIMLAEAAAQRLKLQTNEAALLEGIGIAACVRVLDYIKPSGWDRVKTDAAARFSKGGL